ncbi:hypothetical protein HDU76_002980, partial [Blyttiomyces sp. JEL0837]
MFIISVLRRQIHPKSFEFYCVASILTGVITTLPPQFVGVIGYSDYFGCWYVLKNPRPYIWGFFYGPQIVVAIMSVLLGICIHVSLTRHVRTLSGFSRRDSEQQAESADKTSRPSSMYQEKTMKEESATNVVATSNFDESSSAVSVKPRRESAMPTGGDMEKSPSFVKPANNEVPASSRASVTTGRSGKSKASGDAL